MEHIEADGNLAVERYLLGEMSATEVDEFEEHIFLCGECAEAVKAGAAFADNARAVFKDEALGLRQEVSENVRTRVSWWQKFSFPILAPTFAALVLLCVAGYQRLIVISALRDQLAQSTGAQALPSFALHSVSRSAAQQIDVPAGARYFSVYFDVTVENAARYLCEIRNASGVILSSVPVAQVRPDGTLSLLLERSQFPAGSYTLIVRTGGPEATEIGEYPFQLEYK
ncbi:MAG TPA: zf-HC2 domain-containing protein [Terriglobia bacterium]|nr:zf-HC2 domain-containing protein [Terriglobia bacterium]